MGNVGAHRAAGGTSGDGTAGVAAAGGGGCAGGSLAIGGGVGGVAAAAAAAGLGQAAGGGAEGMHDDGDGLVWGCNPPSPIEPAMAPVAFSHVGNCGQALGAWAETRTEEEHLELRHDLAEHVWADRETLLEPYL